MIPMKDHGKHEFELAADHRPQRPLRYGLLVLSQQVLKALVEDGLDLIQLKQLGVSIEELVEGLVEQLEGNLVRLLPSIVHLVTLAILTYADEGCDVWRVRPLMPADEVDPRKFGPPEVIDDKGLIIERCLEGRYLRLDRCVKEELVV